jgi:hypothetical protein
MKMSAFVDECCVCMMLGITRHVSVCASLFHLPAVGSPVFCVFSHVLQIRESALMWMSYIQRCFQVVMTISFATRDTLTYGQWWILLTAPQSCLQASSLSWQPFSFLCVMVIYTRCLCQCCWPGVVMAGPEWRGGHLSEIACDCRDWCSLLAHGCQCGLVHKLLASGKYHMGMLITRSESMKSLNNSVALCRRRVMACFAGTLTIYHFGPLYLMTGSLR